MNNNRTNSRNVYWHLPSVNREMREKLNGHKSVCIWFTGLSGSGKSTLANEVEKVLFKEGIRTYVLDGDNIRHGLNNNLGFSHEDRTENIRRIGEVSKLFVDAGIIVLAAFISPFKEDRDNVRALLGKENFIEIYVKTELATCENRDSKGIYKKARNGEIKNFTGISSPYEPPDNPGMILNNNKESDLKINVEKIIVYLKEAKIIKDD